MRYDIEQSKRKPNTYISYEFEGKKVPLAWREAVDDFMSQSFIHCIESFVGPFFALVPEAQVSKSSVGIFPFEPEVFELFDVHHTIMKKIKGLEGLEDRERERQLLFMKELFFIEIDKLSKYICTEDSQIIGVIIYLSVVPEKQNINFPNELFAFDSEKKVTMYHECAHFFGSYVLLESKFKIKTRYAFSQRQKEIMHVTSEILALIRRNFRLTSCPLTICGKAALYIHAEMSQNERDEMFAEIGKNYSTVEKNIDDLVRHEDFADLVAYYALNPQRTERYLSEMIDVQGECEVDRYAVEQLIEKLPKLISLIMEYGPRTGIYR